MDEMAVEARISGRVQGVWFRGWTRSEALRRGLRGWVRNEPDGSVRAVIAGPEAEVRDMLAALQDGPETARVQDVRWSETTSPEESGFEVRR